MFTPVSRFTYSTDCTTKPLNHMDTKTQLVNYPTMPSTQTHFNPTRQTPMNRYTCENDYYCERVKPSDEYFLSFYSKNAGIPGPLQRSKDFRINKTTYSTLRKNFIETESLNYAHPIFSNFTGAPVLPDADIKIWNAFMQPVSNFTETTMKKEKCACGKKPKIF